MRRALILAALAAALFLAPIPALADDGSGCRTDGPYVEADYGDIRAS